MSVQAKPDAGPTFDDADRAAQAEILALRARVEKADPATLDLLLTGARTHYGWQDRAVPDDVLREVVRLAQHGPTSMNQQPARFVFVRGAEAKARLLDCLMPANRPKAEAAPVTVIVANDLRFHDRLPQVFPVNPGARDIFEANEAMRRDNAFRNGTLQGAWLILAARALGLDTGPMSGFDAPAVRAAFLDGGGRDWEPNFLVNLGYGDEARVFKRLPRLTFDDVAEIV